MTFTITDDHLKLLRRAYIGWDDCEFGAPAIDCKRPYGNRDVVGDIAKILGWETFDTDDGAVLPKGSSDKAVRLHRELQTVLQIAVVTGEFKTGKYEKAEQYDCRSWKKIDAPADDDVPADNQSQPIVDFELPF